MNSYVLYLFVYVCLTTEPSVIFACDFCFVILQFVLDLWNHFFSLNKMITNWAHRFFLFYWFATVKLKFIKQETIKDGLEEVKVFGIYWCQLQYLFTQHCNSNMDEVILTLGLAFTKIQSRANIFTLSKLKTLYTSILNITQRLIHPEVDASLFHRTLNPFTFTPWTSTNI